MKYLSFIFVFTLMLVPGIASAAGFVPCEGTDCSACHFVEMANLILVWLIGVLMVVFAIMVVAAGFGLVTSGGNPTAKEDAKKKMTNAIIGLIIVLAAWLMVDTLMKALLKGGTGVIQGYGIWSKVECGSQSKTESALDEMTSGTLSSGVSTPAGVPISGTEVDHSTAVGILAAHGVDVKTGAGAADLEGVKVHVLDEVGFLAGDLQAACPTCPPIVVTEATGGSHASGDFSHAEGYKLDLRTNDNPGLVNYVKDTFQPAGTWKDGTPLFYDPSSCGTYAIENDHIDVVYKTGC